MQITLESVEAHKPDVLLPPDPEFAEDYARLVSHGRRIASTKSVALVAICRNAMPWLPMTLDLVEKTGSMFREWSCFVYENDSSDETKDVLKVWQDHIQRFASLNENGRPHLSHTTSEERTVALAEYRTSCQRFVRHGTHPDYVIVFDTDAWGGWSVDGIANSIAWLDVDRELFGLASYSWAQIRRDGGVFDIHYDAFAARLNHWKRRDQNWFHLWHPAVGSEPVEFNSAFGQLAVYRTEPYLWGAYDGRDCEHVTFHRSIWSEAIMQPTEELSMWKFALNPSMRCVSFWVPE